MYVSRVEIDFNNRRKIKDLTHLGAYHNWVEHCFETEFQDNYRSRHLWRLDTIQDNDGDKHQFLLLVSEHKPNLEKLARYGIASSAQVKSYDPFLSYLQQGMRAQFRLTANPTYSVTQSGKRGKVYPHITSDQQLQWLGSRALKSGFKFVSKEHLAINDAALNLNNVDIVSRDFPILHKRGNRTVKLSRVSFEGQLEITDLSTFKNTLVNGLGREKAYGMGLLTIIPE